MINRNVNSYPLLSKIKSPKDIKNFDKKKLNLLCDEVRKFKW